MWLEQFAFVFPITGRLSQRFVYDADADSRAKTPRPHLFETAASRFRGRAAKSGFKNAQLLWGESLQKLEKGWMLPPTPPV